MHRCREGKPMIHRFFMLLALAVLLPAGARGDVFHLAGGGRIEGELLNPREEPRKAYEVRVAGGGTVTLVKEQVAKVESPSEAERQYHKLRVETPATVEGHWKLAEFCRTSNLPASREYHLGEILKLDPEHAEARYGLGYSKVKDKWVRTDEYMRERGYVLHRGSWRTPQEIAVEERKQEVTDAQDEWRRKLKLWRGWLGKKRDAEARREIQAVTDWRAAEAAAELLEDERTSEGKLLWIEVLSKLPTHTAWTALTKYALEDDDDRVRERCITSLEQSGSGPAGRVFLRALDDNDNVRVNRAGIALGRMQDPSAVPALIEHLETKHKFVTPGSGSPGGLGIGVGFGSGGSGLSTGSGPSVKEQNFFNTGVHGALFALTRQNFRTQKEWRDWYIESSTPKGVNLRRRD
jgi:hypothetical protein